MAKPYKTWSRILLIISRPLALRDSAYHFLCLRIQFFVLEPLSCFCWLLASNVYRLWTLLAVTMLPLALKTLQEYQLPREPAEDRRQQNTSPA